MQRATHSLRIPTGNLTIIAVFLSFATCHSPLATSHADTHYVSPSGNHIPPFTNWTDAARTIQAAIDAASSNDVVLVTNGVYEAGSTRAGGAPTRAAVTNKLIVMSVNGPDVTAVVGRGPLGETAIRCAYLADGALLSGFTLTNGHTRTVDDGASRDGGGVFCETGAVVSNCLVAGCRADADGGGVYGGRVVHCSVTGCSAGDYGGGVYSGVVSECELSGNGAEHGGAAAYAAVTMSTLTSNAASWHGGGIVGGTASHCRFLANSGRFGGAAAQADLVRCELTGNTASGRGGGVDDGTIEDSTIENGTAGSGGGVAGTTAVRCTIVSNTAYYGGGSFGGTLKRCVLRGNAAADAGGGSMDGVLNNSLLTGNAAGTKGGGLHSRWREGRAINCTIVANRSGGSGGGVSLDSGVIRNCIIYHNTAFSTGGNWVGEHGSSYRAWSHTCTTPDPGGTSIVTNAPRVVSLISGHIASNSPCVDAGSNAEVSGDFDIDGEERIWNATVDLGCDELVPHSVTGALSLAVTTAYTGAVVGTAMRFEAQIAGRPLGFEWEWGDGDFTSGILSASHAYGAAGDYAVVLRAWNRTVAVAQTVTVHVVDAFTNYVSLSGSGDAPFTSWSTAATNLQEAVDVCLAGGTVRVAEGVYTNGTYMHNGVHHRVALWKPLMVAGASTNAEQTVVVGVGPNGADAVRCAYVGRGAILCGVTLTNGHTATDGDTYEQRSGGGAWCEDGGLVSNCVVAGCAASVYGGGVCGGRIVDCEVRMNRAAGGGGVALGEVSRSRIEGNTASSEGGGIYRGVVTATEVSANSAKDGGGAAKATARECVLRDNTASRSGGGALECTLDDSRVELNWAAVAGGGICKGTVEFCLVVSNTSAYSGGGASQATLTRCELRGNRALGRAGGGADASSLYSCLVVDNEAVELGGGLHLAIANNIARNCTIVRNHSREKGGGVSTGDGHVYNSIVYYNTAALSGNNWANEYGPGRGTYDHCCITPAPGGAGHVTNTPGLVSIDNGHILLSSPCVDAGEDALVEGNVDFDGESRIAGGAVDIGCDELVVGAVTGKLTVTVLGTSTSVVAGAPLFFDAEIGGRPLGYAWQWGDGDVTSNVWSVSHAYAAPGDYELVLQAWNDSDATSATVGIHVVAGYTNYVSLSGSGAPPFTSWATAATNVQSAVDACLAGGTVLVAEGVYTNGVYEHDGAQHRVGLWKPLTVAGASTNVGRIAIVGAGPIGPGAVRCAYVSEGAVLRGVTLTNGHTLAAGDDVVHRSGAGAWCEEGGTVSNCLVTGNAASVYGGGIHGGRVVACEVRRNQAASGGGTALGTVEGSLVTGNTARVEGGGVYGGTITTTVVSGNAAENGGGVAKATVLESVLRGNTASRSGGGALECTLDDSRVELNSAAVAGGGIWKGAAESCLVASNVSAYSGGGASQATLTRCELRGNRALGRAGGGADASKLRSCLVVGNEAAELGGGVHLGIGNNIARNCTIVANHSREKGGGVSTGDGHVYNSIVYYNTATLSGDNWADEYSPGRGTYEYCCTTPAPGGSGHVTNIPGLVGIDNGHIVRSSPCLDAGADAFVAGSVDFDGEGRISGGAVDIGCDELVEGAVTGRLSVAALGASTSVVAGAPLFFEGRIEGRPLGYAWLWGDGKATSNAWSVSHAYAAPGDYDLVLRAWNDSATAATTVGIHVVSGYTNYVALSGSGETPFTSWATAATNLQDAVDVCLAGGTVLVAEGTYTNGTYERDGTRHRVGLWKPLTVAAASTNVAATLIVGDGPIGPDAVRCAYVSEGAVLCGVTLTNGHTLTTGGELDQRSGGGAWCETGGTVSNCLLTGCRASACGGGVYGGSVVGCAVRGNTASSGGGAAFGTVDGCVVDGNTASSEGGGVLGGNVLLSEVVGNSAENGGGVAKAAVLESVIRDNSASHSGGGTSECTVNGTVIEGNTATIAGGGIFRGTIESSLVASNTASFSGGGAYDATLTRCELRGNRALGRAGGGADASNLRSCLVVDNEAAQLGGGVHLATAANIARNCTIVGNHCREKGGGVSTGDGHVYNSIIYYNTAAVSGDNWANEYSPGRGTYVACCATPAPDGAGHVTNLPGLVSIDNGHIVGSSPCVDAGENALVAGNVDFDGESRISGEAVDIGCDELVFGAVTGELTVVVHGASTNVVAGAPLFFDAEIHGRPLGYAWLWGDGDVTSNAWSVSHAYAAPGDYELVFHAWNDSDAATTTVRIHVVSGYTNYVALSGSGEAPFTSWAAAATNLQDAVDACLAGGTVLVAEGVYTNGTHEHAGVRHRVGLWKPLTVAGASTNMERTVIVGAGPIGGNAVRCAYVSEGAVLCGVTLTNGHTLASGSELGRRSGGGAWCTPGGTVSNCLVIACRASVYGGGVYGGRVVGCEVRANDASSGGGVAFGDVDGCVISSNTASREGGGVLGKSVVRSEIGGNSAEQGAGAAKATILDSVLRANTASSSGGGTAECTVDGCVIERNSAAIVGGGVWKGRTESSLIVSNTSAFSGGGAYDVTLTRCELRGNRALGRAGGGAGASTLRSCLVVGNEAAELGGGIHLGNGNHSAHNCTIVGNHCQERGGGVSTGDGHVYNSIIYFNTAAVSGDNWANDYTPGRGEYSHCCTSPKPAGAGNVEGPPLFVDRPAEDLRLRADSPCINAGLNADWMFGETDLDGRSRILNDIVDMGAYETPFVLNVRVLLQGGYRPPISAMTTLTHVLPSASPYAYDARSVPFVPSNVADWVIVHLHDSRSGRAGVTRSVWVNDEGYLIDDEGGRGVVVPVEEGKDYYLTIQHRNHLGVQSHSPVPFVTSTATYDFTVGPDKVLGGTNACVELGPGVWGMLAGDCDGDGKITEVDREIVRQQAGKMGYLSGDCNLDGVVTEADVP